MSNNLNFNVNIVSGSVYHVPYMTEQGHCLFKISRVILNYQPLYENCNIAIDVTKDNLMLYHSHYSIPKATYSDPIYPSNLFVRSSEIISFFSDSYGNSCTLNLQSIDKEHYFINEKFRMIKEFCEDIQTMVL